ncbi:MAG: fucose isomerase [Armatimonadetes bacterium]|nr:fucose isomerase [Armatimonadota bacterium]
MRTTPIGIAMLNDEREHVYSLNNPANIAVVNKWADILRNGLKNVDGSAPEIVVASKIITGVRVAQEVGEELVRKGCKQVIMCYNVWDFPFLAWPFINCFGRDVPILSLSNNNGQYPGNVGLLATDGALRQAGKRTHRIVGEIDDPATQRNVFDWVRASNAATTIKNEVYGLYGGHSMGMETGYFHLTPTIKALGCNCYQIDQYLLVKYAEEFSKADVEKGRKWFEKLLGDRLLYDGNMLTPETLERQIRIYLAMERVNQEEGFDFCGLKGQRELTEHYTLGDVPEMVMNDPYDWRGPKEPMVCATEADAFAAITMQLMKYISGGLPTLFMDVRLYLPELDAWDWCNSGNHASWYASRSYDPAENFKKISFHPALSFYFKAGGASVEFDAAPGDFTFARLGLWDEKPFMFITKGEVLDLPADERKRINNLSNPTWPHVHAKLGCSFDEFIALFPANHVQGVIGDHVRSLVYLCKITGITPIVAGEAGKERIAPIWERVK